MQPEMVEIRYPKERSWPVIVAASLGGLAFAGFVFFAATVGTDRTEVVECNQWKAQSEQYPNYYLTKWQKDQCDAHGIAIDAPVK